MDLIRGKMKHFSLEDNPVNWLDTGSKRLNSVFGHPDLGIPWGKIIELFGNESHGKSVLAQDLMYFAQAAGADCIWYDAENSVNKKWMRTRGLITRNVNIVKPYLGFFDGKEPKFTKQGKLISEPSISPAEVLCDEVTELVRLKNRQNRDRLIFLVVDSVSALETQYEMDSGMAGANMKSNTELSRFLSRLMKSWTSLFATRNVIGVFINQLRTKPGVTFGSPEYTPGGKALKFYAHVRIRINRSAGGRIMHSGSQIGIQGVMKNVKNKVGGVENATCGYKVLFNGELKTLDASKIKRADGKTFGGGDE